MKKLIVLMCMILPLGVVAQEVKIAVVNVAEVFNLMPELASAETQLADISAQWQKEIQTMETDLNAKYEEYMKIQETLTENIRLRKQQELQDIQTRIQNTIPVAQQDIEQKQTELMAPIQEKLQKAIQEVGAEQGYTFIMNTQSMLYTSASATDATQLVKTKLGLQ